MIVWITGMSGAGKTTIAQALYNKLKSKNRNLIFLDGDMIRYIMGNDLGHTIYDRRRNAERIQRLCKTLDEQNINVICSILCIFPEILRKNKNLFSNYYEIYIEMNFEKILQRDNKNIYKPALEGKIKKVVGIDIKYPIPENPDLIINNNEDTTNINDIINKIILKIPVLK